MIGEHISLLHLALDRIDARQVEHMGECLVHTLSRGSRLLIAGNGGSAAHAQHLSAELVGRYQDDTREPCSAIALHADTSSVTAVANDFGWEDVFARQIRAHGRPGDAFLAISTSGQSSNLVRAAEVACRRRLRTLALTGPAPNPLAACSELSICIAPGATATIQEVHQVIIHLLCEVIDEALGQGVA
jgi:D-sedoheptulose 7-phosphate isomerase